jgi:GTP diphosphokinase / guanosine-3',5'-bis(diphosphate) 3'-diphosphatase
MEGIEKITSLLRKTPTADQLDLLNKAYDFAEKAHEGQKRYSGEPYFVHAVETAKNLAKLGMGPVTISAGLLHDVLEDAGIKPEELEKEFGKEILFLIEGVTKLGKVRYKGADRHNESLRKLFVAVSEDIRVLIIKLADRLHNMRTLDYVPEHKQKRIAIETLEIYAPVAHRLGIGKVKGELEDLAFKYVFPKEYAETKEILKFKSRENIAQLEKITKSLMKTLAKEGMINIRTDYRIKHLYSLYKKLKKKEGDIEKIYDVAALRVIVKNVDDCYKILGIVHSIWRPLPERIKDYIAFPKPNGYRALHTTVFSGSGVIFEIQIKTEEMHMEAEYGIASHISYKENVTKSNSEKHGLMWVWHLLPFPKKNPGKEDHTLNMKSSSLESAPEWIKSMVKYQSEISNQEEFEDDLRSDFFQDRIFVFTPKGDVIDLPVESSPIDFAYAIHSDIGNHIFGAKVNGKMVSLNTKLRNGDWVEIQTKNSSKPTEKWLDLVKTTIARRHIKSALQEASDRKGEQRRFKKS